MPHRVLQLWIFCALCQAVAPALAETYIYREADGTRWITDRPMNPERFVFIDKYGRPTATQSCYGATAAVLRRRAEPYMLNIEQFSAKHRVEIAMIKAIIRVESCFDSRAVSRAGAHGLMQLMPATARRYGVFDRFNPEDNLRAGIRHFSELLDYFKNDVRLSLAAYNAGVHNVEKYKGIPPFKETQNYVKKVLHYYSHYREETGLPTADLNH